MTIVNILAAQGFEVEGGGAGCRLLSRSLPNGSVVWVTVQNGDDVPTWGDWMICAYPADWDGAPETRLFDAYADDSVFGLIDAVEAAIDAANASGSATV
jgi:hypothetical protein